MARSVQTKSTPENYIIFGKPGIVYLGTQSRGSTFSSEVATVSHEDLGKSFLVIQSKTSDPFEQPLQPGIAHHDNPLKISSLLAADLAFSEAEKTFRSLHQKWVSERDEFGSLDDMFTHTAYQQIIGMGQEAVPFILRELENEIDDWFWALNAITREDPVHEENKGYLPVMRDAWLEWGRANGYI